MDIARRPEEHSNKEDNAWGEEESPPAAAPQREPEGRVSHSELGGDAPCPSAAGLSVREDDSPRGGGARKWALRGGTLQLRQRVNRTLSKKVNRARGEPVKHCGESRKEERRAERKGEKVGWDIHRKEAKVKSFTASIGPLLVTPHLLCHTTELKPS